MTHLSQRLFQKGDSFNIVENVCMTCLNEIYWGKRMFIIPFYYILVAVYLFSNPDLFSIIEIICF